MQPRRLSSFTPYPSLLLQFVGRWKIETDPAQPHAFDDTDVPITNPDLDPLLQVRLLTSKCRAQ